MKIVIFDFDGTISLNDHRKHYVEKPSISSALDEAHKLYPGETLQDDATRIKYAHDKHFGWKPNWDAFFEECDKDLPNLPVIDLFKTLKAAGYFLVILSGRSDQVTHKSGAWLERYGIIPHLITFRSQGDFTPDHELKKQMLQDVMHTISQQMGITSQQVAECIQFFVDDRKKVVDMWRSLGFTCFQVAEGNF